MLSFEPTPVVPILSMSSREIAELTGKDHKHVLTDVRNLLVELNIDSAEFSAQYKDSTGRALPCFNLPKRETLILISGYNILMRARIIDRWQELETTTRQSVVAIPNFSNPAEAARAWAEQYEARQIAEKTKAEIGSRREATAMATASVASRQAQQLQIQLDQSKRFATVKRVEAVFPGHKFDWRILKRATKVLCMKALDVFDQNYGTVKAYPAEVWREAYGVDITPEPPILVR